MLNLSTSEENYIKGIYHLQGGDATRLVLTNDIAAHMATAPASVTDMVKKLKRKKLISYKAYYGCKLTDEGQAVALFIIRRHRLWEYFLSEKLGFDWGEVHEIAEGLEHINNEELINRLDSFLGHPKFDPHGDPIPDALGNMQKAHIHILNDLETGATAIVCGVKNQSADALELLKIKKIKPGTTLVIERKFPYDGSMEIKIGRKSGIHISRALACEILVK